MQFVRKHIRSRLAHPGARLSGKFPNTTQPISPPPVLTIPLSVPFDVSNESRSVPTANHAGQCSKQATVTSSDD